jgi:predicted nucleic acid-binding protein
MSARFFLDTNIFVYAYDDRNPLKRSIANDLIRSVGVSGEGVISFQVIQEFFNFALIKTSSRMRHEDAQRYLLTVFRPLQIIPSSFEVISNAIRIQERYRLSWYDSLIVSAAQHGGCEVLYSEDLQHGQVFDRVRVQNPFV